MAIIPGIGRDMGVRYHLTGIGIAIGCDTSIGGCFSGLGYSINGSSNGLIFNGSRAHSKCFTISRLGISLTLAGASKHSFIFRSTPVASMGRHRRCHVGCAVGTGNTVNKMSIALSPSARRCGISVTVPGRDGPDMGV